MRWGSASPNPAPDGCGELFLGWAGACQVLGGDMSCWQLAHGHHHPVGIQEITTLLTLRISPSQQHPEYHDPINIQDCLRAPRRSTPRCLLPPHPRHCHPMPGQRYPPGPSTPHHGLKELGWSQGHPTAEVPQPQPPAAQLWALAVSHSPHPGSEGERAGPWPRPHQ